MRSARVHVFFTFNTSLSTQSPNLKLDFNGPNKTMRPTNLAQ